MNINQILDTGLMSHALLRYIIEYYQMPLDFKVSVVETDRRDYVVPMMGSINPFDFEAQEHPTVAQMETIHLEFLEFGSREGERVRAVYAPQTNTLYIRQPAKAIYRVPQPSSKRFWKRRTGENLILWGERLHKTGAIDDPVKRWAYQSAVLTAPINFIRKMLKK